MFIESFIYPSSLSFLFIKHSFTSSYMAPVSGPRTPSYTFAFYISGHGWGHATRANQVVSDLLSMHPAQHKVYITTDASDFIFQSVITQGAVYRRAPIDAGIVQPLAYTVDRERTIAGLRDFLEHRDEKILREVEWLRSIKADCVVCDAPFLPCAAASMASIPAALVTNFTFDQIYLHLRENDALDEQIEKLVAQTIVDYCYADLLIRLPGSIRMPSFDNDPEIVPETPATSSDAPLIKAHGPSFLPFAQTSDIPSPNPFNHNTRRIVDIPLVFRPHRLSRGEVLSALHIPEELQRTHKFLLLSFGGQILSNLPTNPLPPNWLCIVCGAPESQELPPGFYRAPRDAYVPDLTHASDAVLGKLGYGTCSEAIGHSKPLIYVPRPQFVEEEGLKRLMNTQGSCVELEQLDFEAGKWADALIKTVGMPGCCEESKRLPFGGGVVAARVLVEYAEERKILQGDMGSSPSESPISPISPLSPLSPFSPLAKVAESLDGVNRLRRKNSVVIPVP